MSFATLQQRVNTTALKRLGAGSAILLGGVSVAGDFLAPYAQLDMGSGGVSACAPVLVVTQADAATTTTATPVVADGTSYAITAIEPDGFGLVRLLLELA
jgi:hypothetical protein